MADPLSIATGILTFMGACKTLASTIQKLHRLRKAPRELEELQNEISSLQSYTKDLNELVDMHGGGQDGMVGQTSLRSHVEKARDKIQIIHHFLEDTLLSASSSIKIRTSAWLKWQTEFNRLRQELRDVRLEIESCMGLFSAAGHRQHQLQLEKMVIQGRAMHDRDLNLLRDLQESLHQQRPMLAMETEMQLNNMSQTIQATIREEVSSLTMPNTRRRRSEDLLRGGHGELLDSDTRRPRSQSSGSPTTTEKFADVFNEDSLSSQGILSIKARSQSPPNNERSVMNLQDSQILRQHEPTVSLQLSHRQSSDCRRPCSCQCHRSSKHKTPDFLRHVIGQLLVGYAGISSSTLPCNEHACAQRQKPLVRIQYSFPFWSLIQQMLTVVSYSGGTRGPEKVLRMSRIRPGLDEVFIQVQSGNTSRLKQLFAKGGASPLDASDTGWTLLHYALTAGQLMTAKFLKDVGADMHAESTWRETPFDVSWNRILSGCLDAKSELLLREVFNDDDQLDQRQFTPLHKIVLGMIGSNLRDQLEVSTASIDALDSSGYTPLAWASARGDHESVVLLLEHGASLSIANDVGAEPIHLAAQTGNIPTIRTLVSAGADVNSEVRGSHMTPIHFAAEYQDSSQQILGLVDLGARVDGRDYLSWTPLHWASWRGHCASVDALLRCSATILAATLDGNAPIMLAVANNSHECIQRLIQAGADASVVRDSQWNVLHYAAIGGSVHTLHALSGADLSGVDLEGLRTKDTGQTVLDMLSARLEARELHPEKAIEYEEWKQAWDDLLAEPSQAVDPIDGPLDTFCPPSRSNTDSVYEDADDQPFGQRDDGSEPRLDMTSIKVSDPSEVPSTCKQTIAV